jgi:hypothetical protein
VSDHRPLLQATGFEVELRQLRPHADSLRRAFYEKMLARQGELMREVDEKTAESNLREARAWLGNHIWKWIAERLGLRAALVLFLLIAIWYSRLPGENNLGFLAVIVASAEGSRFRIRAESAVVLRASERQIYRARQRKYQRNSALATTHQLLCEDRRVVLSDSWLT